MKRGTGKIGRHKPAILEKTEARDCGTIKTNVVVLELPQTLCYTSTAVNLKC